MKQIAGLGVLSAVCLAGVLIAGLLPFPLPASVIGMLLLFALLLTGLVKTRHIEGVSHFLLHNMAFFFLPSGVAILGYLDALSGSALAILVVCVLSTLVTFGATALTVAGVVALQDRARKGREKRNA